MRSTLFPSHFDNIHPGHTIALWIFAAVVFVKGAIATNSIFNGRTVAASADGIPLDMFPPEAAQAVVSLFAIWGLAQLVLCLLCVLALIRYRAMVPLLFGVLLLEHLARRFILVMMPIVRSGPSPGSAINYALLAAMVAGLILSLWRNGRKAATPAA